MRGRTDAGQDVSPDDRVRDAACALLARGVRHLRVCDGERVVGWFDDRDLLRCCAEGRCDSAKVSEYMQRDVPLGPFTGIAARLPWRKRVSGRSEADLLRESQARELAEEERRRHGEELARASRAADLGQITATIAHEVKQPLFAIVSNAQTARRLLDQRGLDLVEVREALDDIASDGMRASRIIDNVRAQVRKGPNLRELLCMNEVVRDAARLLEPELRQRGLGFVAVLEDRLPPVLGEAIGLQQVLQNLVLNAARAMEDGGPGEVTLRTRAAEGRVHVAVEDRGVGLGGLPLDRIFEPFYTTHRDGTGLGLAICRAIVERHGGRLVAVPNPETGATFEFSLEALGGEQS